MDVGTATVIAAGLAALSGLTGSVLVFLSRRENRADHAGVYAHVVKLHDKIDGVDHKIDSVESKLDAHILWEEEVKYPQSD